RRSPRRAGRTCSAARIVRPTLGGPGFPGGCPSPTIRHALCLSAGAHGPSGLRAVDDVLLQPPPSLEAPGERRPRGRIVGALWDELARGVAPPVGAEVRAPCRAPP